MDELLKRLSEIKAEAEALRANPEAEGRVERLRELVTERRDLEAKLEEEKAFAEATAEVPEPVKAEEEKPAEAEGEAEGDKPAEAPKEAEGEKPAEAEPEVKVPLAAAAGAVTPPDSEVPVAEQTRIPLVASGGVGGTEAGAVLAPRDLDRIHRHAGVSNPGKGSMRSIFASISVGSGPALNKQNTAEANTALMASAQPGAIQAITAAAAFCGPDDIVLDICEAGTDERPVQGLFGTVPVRGPFVYMKSASMADTAAGVSIWEEADQIALDPADDATWKPSVDLSCRAETTVTPYAIPASVLMGTWQQLSAPEQIANFLSMLQKQYARIADQRLLDRIRAQSHVLSAGANGFGLWTSLQATLASLQPHVADRLRATFEGYVIIAPYGFVSALAADEAMKGFSQNVARQRVQQILAENYGVRIVESYERDSTVAAADPLTLTAGLGGAATPITLGTQTYSTWPLYILNPSSYVAGSSDVVEAGYHRDANLVRQNLVRYFLEGMEFLEHTCPHLSFVVELNTCANGAAAPVGDELICIEAL